MPSMSQSLSYQRGWELSLREFYSQQLSFRRQASHLPKKTYSNTTLEVNRKPTYDCKA